MGLSLGHDTAHARSPEPTRSGSGGGAGGRQLVPFRAELDLAELDDRGRPGAMWTGRSLEISRACLVFRSRRMCYEGRELMIAVHLVDDTPTPLFGAVTKSDYDGDGLYKTVLTLRRPPETDAVRTWVANLVHRVRDERRV